MKFILLIGQKIEREPARWSLSNAYLYGPYRDDKVEEAMLGITTYGQMLVIDGRVVNVQDGKVVGDEPPI